MKDIRNYFSELNETQRDVLEWFYNNHNTVQTLPTNSKTDIGNQIVSPAAGIFKPKNTNFVISVKQTLNGPYKDSNIIKNKKGTGLFFYHQKSESKIDSADIHSIYYEKNNVTENIALMNNKNKNIPIGVVIQQKEKKGTRNAYRFLIGMVLYWYEGFFIIQIANSNKLISTDTTLQEIRNYLYSEDDNSFSKELNFSNIVDAREKQKRSIVIRQGQTTFRNELLDAYNKTCAISGIDVEPVLEAAHIFPYMGTETNVVNNGLLLRSDLHLLFDKKLIRINNKYIVELSPNLKNTVYSKFDGVTLNLPHDVKDYPDKKALANHYDSCEF